jgi:tetratricopeptide (TPR) repeat protein
MANSNGDKRSVGTTTTTSNPVVKIMRGLLLAVLVLALLLAHASCVSAQEGIFNKLFSFFRSAAPEQDILVKSAAGSATRSLEASIPISVAKPEPVVSLDSPSPALVSHTNEDIMQMLATARQLVEKGEYLKARDAYLSILEIDPVNVQANSLLGAVFLVMKEPNLAEGFLFTAVKQSEWQDLVSVNNLAECLRVKGDIDLAEKTALKGVSVDKTKDPTGLLTYTLANIYLSKQNYKLASDWFLAAAFKQKTRLDTWLTASTLQFPVEYQDYKMAENTLLEGLTFLPNNPSILYYLGVMMYNTKRYVESVTFLERSLSIDPNSKDAAQVLQLALENININTNDLRILRDGF